MPISIAACARLLGKQGLRHHVDTDEGVIWLVFVARAYQNLRGENLVVMGLETPDDGRRVRAWISRAFAPGDDPARTCLELCRLAADIPLVAVEFDADQADLRLVVETTVEEGSLSASQLASMIDRLVEAAEAWAPLLASQRGQSPDATRGNIPRRGAA